MFNFTDGTHLISMKGTTEIEHLAKRVKRKFARAPANVRIASHPSVSIQMDLKGRASGRYYSILHVR
jgi:hypothetical protein